MERPYSSEMGKGTDDSTETKAALGSNLWCEGTGWGKGAAEAHNKQRSVKACKETLILQRG